MDAIAAEKFGNRIRTRVCGLCVGDGGILLINHRGLYSHDFWAPPGGAVVFGETAESALKREFVEECRTEIQVGDFLFGCEFIRPPLHAVELFFEVKLNAIPQLGHDPELNDRQMISELKFVGGLELKGMVAEHLHGIFARTRDPLAIMRLRGYFKIT
jgi:8-oxo-dGTP diphosphatase